MQGNMKKTDVWTNTPIHSRRNRKFPELDKGEKKKRLRTKGVTIEKDPQYGVISRMKLQVADMFESKWRTFHTVLNGKFHT